MSLIKVSLLCASMLAAGSVMAAQKFLRLSPRASMFQVRKKLRLKMAA